MEEEQSDFLDRDQILSHFQEITNLFDVEQSQAILESTHWNLDQAIQSFFNGETMITEDLDRNVNIIEPRIDDTNHMQTNNSTNTHFPNLSSYIQEISSSPPIAPVDLYTNGTSVNAINNNSNFDSFLKKNNNHKRLLTFNIEFYATKFQLYVPDSSSVLELKQLISEEIKLPYKYQKLKGWKNKDALIADHMELSSLNLPLENNLYVINTSSETCLDASTSTSSLSKIVNKIDPFELNIKIIYNKCQTNNENDLKDTNNKSTKSYRLQFDSTTKFNDLKQKILKLAEININEQEWWFTKSADNNEDDDTCSLDKLIESGHVLSMPLTVILKNDSTLEEIKNLHDSLSESNTKIAVASTSVQNKPLLFTNLNSNEKLINSKLTPDKSNQINKLSFLVTVKTSANPFNKLITENLMPCTSKTNTEYDEEDDVLEQLEINPTTGLITEKKRANDQIVREDLNDENDSHELEEEDIDDSFVLEPGSKQKSLIPASCPPGDEYIGTTLFVEEFFKRYQPIIPLFFIGTLDNAIKEALLCSARNRKLLGIYLHSDKSVCRHIFCSKTLCDENVVNFLISNFVVWGWDITNAEHEAGFFSSCSKYLGSVVANHLKNSKIIYPAFLIVNRTRGTNEVIAVIEGDASQDAMMNRLMQAYEMFEAQRVKDEKDEQTRDEREKIKREQDAAYHQSLEMDKAKRQKQTEEFERQKQAAHEHEQMQKQKINEKENFMKNCLQSLTNEPDDSIPSNKITKIRFRLPNGETIQRKFLITDKIEQILYFTNGSGYLNDEFKLLTSWPRRDLSSAEQSKEQTIEEMKLFPQETLTVERRS